MLTISIILLLIALILMPIGIRGRVAARGRFCKACGFDLQGIELSQEGTPCPECGRLVGRPRTIRPIRREKRKLMITLAAVLFVIGAGLFGIHITGNTSSVFAVMPDRVVLSASERGFDEAIDELIVRLGANNQPPKWVWDGAIRAALTHQRDTDQEWKPRWGEIISLAIQHNKLGEEQLAQFLQNGHLIEMWLRDRIRAGDSYVSYWCEQTLSRTSALNRADTGFMLRVANTASGVKFDGQEHENVQIRGGMLSSGFMIPRAGSYGSSATGSGVMIPSSVRDRLKAGDTFELWMDVQLTLESRIDDTVIEADPIRFTQSVTVVGDEDPIVRVVDDPSAAKRVREGISIEPITIRDVQPMAVSSYREFAYTSILFTAKPRAIAGTLYLRRHAGGEMFKVASLASLAKPVDMKQSPTPLISHSHQITIQINTEDQERVKAFERVTSDGVVDVVFRTDPAAAESNAKISEVVDLDLVFVGVPLLRKDSDQMISITKGSEDIKIPASEYVED